MSDPRTTIASYASSGGLVLFGVNASDFGVMAGMVLALLTFLINWYYKHQHLRIIERRVNQPDASAPPEGLE